MALNFVEHRNVIAHRWPVIEGDAPDMDFIASDGETPMTPAVYFDHGHAIKGEHYASGSSLLEIGSKVAGSPR